MKLLVRQYVASLRERGELDAILPDLLSEIGYDVISRPSIGTRQYGVDIAAVGRDEDGERKLFLFSVKQGDLTRTDWDGTPQALRPSLDEIREIYLRLRVARQHQKLKVVICLCFGGDVLEAVQDNVIGYIEANETERISFKIWNGDVIASLLIKGVLRESLLPSELRTSFQKAVAMVDEPEIAFFALRPAGPKALWAPSSFSTSADHNDPAALPHALGAVRLGSRCGQCRKCLSVKRTGSSSGMATAQGRSGP